METHGEVGKLDISEATYQIINDDPGFSFVKREPLLVKGKAEMSMYIVTAMKEKD